MLPSVLYVHSVSCVSFENNSNLHLAETPFGRFAAAYVHHLLFGTQRQQKLCELGSSLGPSIG